MNSSDHFVEALCDILIKNNAIKKEEADALKKLFHDRSSVTFDNFLLQEGLVDKGDLLNALSQYYKVPAFDVVGYFFDHMLVTKFPKEILFSKNFIPIEVEDDNILLVVTSQPDNEDLIAVIGNYLSYDVQCMVGLYQDIIDAIEEFYDQAVTIVQQDVDIDAEQRQEQEAREIEEGEQEE